MRAPVRRGLIGAAVLSIGLALPGLALADDPAKPAAGDPVTPDLGAGPHRDRSSQTSGEGEKPRQETPAPVVPGANPGAASTGPSMSPNDERSARDREEDQRRATESKDKMKKRKGYKDDVPAPRVSID